MNISEIHHDTAIKSFPYMRNLFGITGETGYQIKQGSGVSVKKNG